MLRTVSSRLGLLRAASGRLSCASAADDLCSAAGAAPAAAAAAVGGGGLVRQLLPLLPRRWLSSLPPLGSEDGDGGGGVGLGLAADVAATTNAGDGGDGDGVGVGVGGDGSSVDARRLYVANLNYRSAASDVAEEFGRVGDVVDVVIPVDLDGRPRGFAFVEMATQEAAAAATQRLDGATFMGRELRVAAATPRGRARQRHTWGRSRAEDGGGGGGGGEGGDDDLYSGGNGGRRPRKWNRRGGDGGGGRGGGRGGGDRYGSSRDEEY